jgi:hypothetical protein
MTAPKVQKGYREVLLRVLGDGEWHTFGECYYALESIIAPEDATRKSRQDRSGPPIEDLDAQIKDGKERQTIAVLSSLQCEQQGFKNTRAGRKYRLRPDTMHEVETIRYGARVAFRALLHNPIIRSGLAQMLTTSNRDSLNPAQQYWIEFALEPEETAQPYIEES